MDLRELVDAVSRGFTSLGGGPHGLPQRLWQDTNGFAGKLLLNVTQRWLPFYSEGHACGVTPIHGGVPMPCGGTAMLACGACGRPCCLEHAQVDQYGGGTCLVCISELMAQKHGAAGAPGAQRGRGAPPPHDVAAIDEQKLERAYKVLGLKKDASYEEARRAHRKLAAKYHPDRAQTAVKKREHEQRPKLVNEASAEVTRQHDLGKVAA